jgi:hypothetical protein
MTFSDTVNNASILDRNQGGWQEPLPETVSAKGLMSHSDLGVTEKMDNLRHSQVPNRTSASQDLVRSLLFVTAFIHNLLDSPFPFIKTHRLFLFDCGIAR